MNGGMTVITKGEIVQNNSIHQIILWQPTDRPGYRQPKESCGHGDPNQAAFDAPTQGRYKGFLRLRAFRHDFLHLINFFKVAMVIVHRSGLPVVSSIWTSRWSPPNARCNRVAFKWVAQASRPGQVRLTSHDPEEVTTEDENVEARAPALHSHIKACGYR